MWQEVCNGMAESLRESPFNSAKGLRKGLKEISAFNPSRDRGGWSSESFRPVEAV